MATSISFFTGGQRSGKSSQSLKMAESLSKKPIYLATSNEQEAKFEERVRRHKAERGKHWRLIEEAKYIGHCELEPGAVVLLDCITLWLSNLFFYFDADPEKTLESATQQWELLISKDIDLIVVSNEIGMGVIPMGEVSRDFVDLQGFMNQRIAHDADRVVFMVSGIPMTIKQ